MPFKIRKVDFIQAELGKKSVPEGFSQVPVHTYKETRDNPVQHTDIEVGGCYYSKLSKVYYLDHLELIPFPEYMLSELRYPLSVALNLSKTDTEEMNLYNLTDYTDAIMARLFEGLDVHYNFSKHELFMINGNAKFLFGG